MHLACFFSYLKAFWNIFTSLEAGRGTWDSNEGNHRLLQSQWIMGSVCMGETERTEYKKWEEKKKKGNREKEAQVSQKWFSTFFWSGRSLEPSHQSGQKFANLSHRSLEMCQGQPQCWGRETAWVVFTIKLANGSFPGDSVVKNPPANAGDTGDRHSIRKIPWRRKWQPTPVFLPGESHGQRKPGGLHSMGSQELETTEWLSTQHAHTTHINYLITMS